MIELDAVEARILGSLVEKSLTTPDLYPLTLNSLLNACNQKTSREPVMELGLPAIEASLGALREKGLVAQRFDAGGRAAKWSHRIDALLHTENPKAIGVVCVLLLRGPQTLGELKTRTERLCSFADAAELDALLRELAAWPGGAIVERAPRQPGQKEDRYRQLFTANAAPSASAPPAASAAAPAAAPPSDDRLAALEKRVAALETALQSLERRLPPPQG